jgi:hypothetical protein
LLPPYSLLFSALASKFGNLLLKSLIHFELILVQSERHGSSFSFPHAHIQFSQQNLLKRLFSSSNVLWSLCKKLGGCSYVDSYLHLLFYSTGLHVFFCVSCAVFIAVEL